MTKNRFILTFLLLSFVTKSFSQELSVDTFYSANRQDIPNSILMEDSIELNCVVDSVIVYHDYSVAVLHVKDSTNKKRLTVVGELAQFGAIDISKTVGQVYKMYLHRIHPFKGEMNPCDISYVSIAFNENGPLFLNTNELPNCEIYGLDSLMRATDDKAMFHTLEDMYYAAVDAFLNIGRNHRFIAENVPQYVSSEHFYTPFRMFIEKRKLPEGMEFCDGSDLKKKITIKHPYVYCWYFGTQVNDDTITIWAWAPSFRKKGLHLQGSFCTYYWIVFQYQNNGWVVKNVNVSQI